MFFSSLYCQGKTILRQGEEACWWWCRHSLSGTSSYIV
ncbi:hypothetical protein BDA96_05G159500 [Sorghum bicolor]|uniref:Uncharacterized protein n=1 Tax=Sorghum bicolor TaxID=4558 RepID=A0A921UFK2_SORBI|nr:hypothetical protein BDA96_05G159500 [Sorghum bicolor]